MMPGIICRSSLPVLIMNDDELTMTLMYTTKGRMKEMKILSFFFFFLNFPSLLEVFPFRGFCSSDLLLYLSPDLSSIMVVFHFMLIVFVFPAVPPPPILGYFLISSLGLFNSYSPHLCTNKFIFQCSFHLFFLLHIPISIYSELYI